MYITGSAIVLAKIKNEYILKFDKVNSAKQRNNSNEMMNSAIGLALDAGFSYSLPSLNFSAAMVGLNVLNGFTYAEDAVKTLAQGFDPSTGNCFYENTFDSNELLPTLKMIYDELASSYIIIAIDETNHSVMITKNSKDVRQIYQHYANGFIDDLGYGCDLILDRESRTILHPNFDPRVSDLTKNLVGV